MPPLLPLASGQYVPKQSKSPVPLILFVVMSLYFALVCAPYLDSGANPSRNMKYLHILVADFDGEEVGASLTAFLKDLPAIVAPEKIPSFTFEVVSPTSGITSPSDLSERVLNGEGWAGELCVACFTLVISFTHCSMFHIFLCVLFASALYATHGASRRLRAATAHGCSNGVSTSSYDPSEAVQFVYDEGRNSQIADGPVLGFLNSALPHYTAAFAAQYLSSYSVSELTACSSSASGSGSGASLLVNPISFSAINLTPIAISPLGNNALTVGNILVAVLGSLFMVNAVYNGE